MSVQRFDIVPPGKFARMVPLLIGALAPIILLIGIASISAAQHKALALRDVLPAVLVLPIAGLLLASSIYRRNIRIQDGTMAFGLLPWRRIPVAALDLDAARIIDLNAHRDLQPVLRIAGSGLPGFRSGLFALRDRRRGQLLLTDWRRVLVLPKRDGGLVLLSPERPEALLTALLATAGGDSARGAS